MKYILISIIYLYWLIPKSWRRKCIFKTNCSLHVFNTAKENGFVAGLRALKLRYKQCRCNYSFYTTDDNKEWIILADNTVIERQETLL